MNSPCNLFFFLVMYRSYHPNQVNDPVGKLPEMAENAAASSSNIQKYVDYVLGVPAFGELANKTIASIGSKYNWKANFRDMDAHLDTAQENAINWNVKVS